MTKMTNDNYLGAPIDNWIEDMDDQSLEEIEKLESALRLRNNQLRDAENDINSLCAEILDIVQAAGWCPVYSHPRGVIGIVEDLKKERDKYRDALGEIKDSIRFGEEGSAYSIAAKALEHSF